MRNQRASLMHNNQLKNYTLLEKTIISRFMHDNQFENNEKNYWKAMLIINLKTI